jgi:hypothetical protein
MGWYNSLKSRFSNQNSIRNISKSVWLCNQELIEICNNDIEQKDLDELYDDLNKIQEVQRELHSNKYGLKKKLRPKTKIGKLKFLIFWLVMFYFSYLILSIFNGFSSLEWDLGMFVWTPIPMFLVFIFLTVFIIKMTRPSDIDDLDEDCKNYLTNSDLDLDLINRLNDWVPYLTLRMRSIRLKIELRITYLEGKE